MKLSRLTVPIAIVALLAGCAQKTPEAPTAPPAPPPPDSAAVQAELSDALNKALAAFQAKDSAAVAALFTDDATWILPNATTYKGRAAIQKGAEEFLAQFETVSFAPAVIDKLVVISDTEALTFTLGSFTVTTKDKKAPATMSNPFADYWQKGADGVWRIAYEVNAEGPMPAAPAQP
jgi:uncharacterized protein (TIGR02246 family)